MAYQTTIGWSILASGITTLILKFALPGDSMYWGIGLVVLGIIVLFIRQ